MRWIAHGQPETCFECLEDQIKNFIPVDRRKNIPYPCPIHGDPRELYAENYQALMIYGHLPAQTVYVGEKPRTIRELRIETINILCEWYGIDDHLELLQKLEMIHGELNQDIVGGDSRRDSN